MKKYITLIVLLIFTILSCEKDDICIETTTPNLIIRFYNFENQTEIKQVQLDSVWAVNKIGVEQYKSVSIDSIVIPLNLNENNTLYKLSSNLIVDEINFTYSLNDIFVSRSCGYKTTFENIQIESNTTNWIKDISINNSTIDNETAAHINIFH